MLGLALLVLAGFTFFGTNIDLGIRYLLPLYPLAFILTARLWTIEGRTEMHAMCHPEPPREGSSVGPGDPTLRKEAQRPEVFPSWHGRPARAFADQAASARAGRPRHEQCADSQDDKRGTMPGPTRFVASLLLIGLAIESFSVCPRYFTFFNAFSGGPARGWKIVNDSNFDWGQGLIDLKNWQDEQNAGPIELAYWGIVDPEIYGIDYVPFGKGKDEKYVAISSYFLVGQRQRTSATHGEPWVIQVPYYNALQAMKPIANPSGTIFIFTREQIEAAKCR
jgi:hypothetical protein